MFESLFTITSTTITVSDTLLMLLFGLISGIIISFTYMKTYPEGNYSQNFALTMVLLPLVISLIIMLIGSDIAAAFSLAGAFSIIRFRSAPGEPKDIAYVLFAMSSGLAAGVGAGYYTVLFALFLCIIMFILSKLNYAKPKHQKSLLKITIPEDLAYQEEFQEVFDAYQIQSRLTQIKNTSLGSLYQLFYEVELHSTIDIQQFINDLRIKNSNLNITLTLIENNDYRM
jgi:hypothetical protein